MRAIPFKIEHLAQYNSWLEAWEIKEIPTSDYYPSVGGFIVENCAAAFLYLTNTSLAFCEHIVVNPAISREDKTTSINLIDDALNKFAKENNVKLIVGRSFNNSFLERAKNRGWDISSKQFNMMYRKIGE